MIRGATDMSEKRIYLDMCCWKRPFDDQSQDRIRLETEAIVLIIEQYDRGQIALIRSAGLDLENDLNPREDRRQKVSELLDRCSKAQSVTSEVQARTAELTGIGFKPFDALHLALAEAARAEVLLTCDRRFLRTARRNCEKLRCRVVNPIEHIQQEEEDL